MNMNETIPPELIQAFTETDYIVHHEPPFTMNIGKPCEELKKLMANRNALGAAFIDDPEVYSPEVVSGMSNFFNSLANGQVSGNLAQILQDLLGTAVQPVQPQPVVAQPGG
jgi:hypothetical protein